MGYGKGAAAEALRQSNNDIPLSLQVLHEHPELLSLPDPGSGAPPITDQMIAQVLRIYATTKLMLIIETFFCLYCLIFPELVVGSGSEILCFALYLIYFDIYLPLDNCNGV